MFFNYRDPNAELIAFLQEQSWLYFNFYRDNRDQREKFLHYSRRIDNACDILRVYNYSLFFNKKDIPYLTNNAEYKELEEKKFYNLDDILSSMELLTIKERDKYNPITNLNAYYALSSISAILGLASIILGIALKSHLYAIMNNWLAFGAIVLPLIVVGGAVLIFGIFEASDANEHLKQWNNYCIKSKENKIDFKVLEALLSEAGTSIESNPNPPANL